MRVNALGPLWAALTYLSKHLAAAHAHTGVDVVCVAPGATETAMFAASTLGPMGAAARAAFVGGMPKGRLIQPRDVADAVVWVATTPAGRLFHGAVLDASMGLGVRPGLQTEAGGGGRQP
ncbi:hypothetical protein I4F81_007178 [Pyropia yezoensis]|uniref:Uncharacterized protein n=1 Tax=Pyropia yezoensis TaxID=2788 RepID=A0ACC3C2S9_PYRYE|nr:hypothetical protein I4F81_007178 [Neopyropia yezoensis]